MSWESGIATAGFIIADGVNRYSRYFNKVGLDSERLQDAAGIAPELLRSPGALIPAQNAYRLMESASRTLGTDTLGLDVADQEGLEDVYGLGPRLLGARTIWEHISLATMLTGTRTSAQSFGLQRRKEKLRVFFHHRVPPRLATHQIDLESIALTVKRFRAALGPQWCPDVINFAYPFGSSLARDDLFSESDIQTSGQSSWIEFPFELSREVFPRESPRPNSARTGIPTDDFAFPKDVLGLIRSQVKQLAPRGQFNVESIANSLGMSQRTMQRILHDRSLTFRTILTGVRVDQACSWLAETDKPIVEIAFDLGYSDPANFSRAFRHHLGVSPSTFRKAHREPG